MESIAIIGMAGRFPGADNVPAFWENLRDGIESITHFSDAELELHAPTSDGLREIRARGVLADADRFDAAFFNIHARDAEQMDPQQRVFLECAWEALENAGCDPERYPGLIGVWAGASLNSYLLYNLCADREFITRLVSGYQQSGPADFLGNAQDFLATRVSYKLDLRGPSLTVQTACSTSLVAVAQACQALLGYQTDMALAGGVSISFPQRRAYAYQEGGMASADGHTRTFDADAAGTVFSSGAGVVVLKRLSDAQADGDHIVAVIKGAAVNNDGAGKVSYTAPSIGGQAVVIQTAQALAGVDPATISYVEAHGTATPLGDPIELAGLTQAFRAGGATGNGFLRARFAQDERRPPGNGFRRGGAHQDGARAPARGDTAEPPFLRAQPKAGPRQQPVPRQHPAVAVAIGGDPAPGRGQFLRRRRDERACGPRRSAGRDAELAPPRASASFSCCRPKRKPPSKRRPTTSRGVSVRSLP